MSRHRIRRRTWTHTVTRLRRASRRARQEQEREQDDAFVAEVGAIVRDLNPSDLDSMSWPEMSFDDRRGGPPPWPWRISP